MIRTLSIALLSLGLMAGCSKKEEKKVDPAAKTADPAAKPADPAATGTTPTTPTTPPATGTTPAGAMDMAKAEALMNEMSSVIEKSGKDCDKMATDLKVFIDKNKDTMKASKDFEKNLSPEDKKKWDEKGKAMIDKHGAAIGACMTNEKFGAVMKEMAEE